MQGTVPARDRAARGSAGKNERGRNGWKVEKEGPVPTAIASRDLGEVVAEAHAR